MNSNNIEGILKDIFGMSLLDAKKNRKWNNL